MNAQTYSVKIKTVGDLEEFTAEIKNSVVDQLATIEKFSAIRLRNAKMAYTDWMHPSKLGFAHASGMTNSMVVTDHGSALTLAGTIVHELAHVLVGAGSAHNEDFHDACKVLGLLDGIGTHAKDEYVESDFAPWLWTTILAALKRLHDKYPSMVYDADIEIPKPAGQADDYLPFQKDGIRWMLANPHNILLADEPGLGKTVQAIGYINVIHPKTILVICPNNMKLTWKRHFEDWCVWPDLLDNLEVAHTNLYMCSDVVIMNYEAAVKWAGMLSKKWDLLIFDEGHYLKNPSAKRSKVCYKLHASKEIIITGTPIVNYPYEAFPLLHKLDRENWPEYGAFEAEYGSKTTNKLGRNLNRLNARLRATIMLRRQKSEVLKDLPRKRRQIVEFEVPDEIRGLIDREKKLFDAGREDPNLAHFINSVMSETSSDIAEADVDWAAIIEAMRFTRRYAFEEMAKIAHEIARAKVPLALEHIENILEAKEKVIVFGHHRDVLQRIADHFRGQSVLLMGGNSDQAAVTQHASDKFANDESCTVFVGGMSLAQGYSLKGSSNIVFIEEDWVPGIMTQAEDRSHGINRGDLDTKSLLIQHLVFENSLDTYKAKLTIKKQKSIDRAMNK